MTEAYNMDCMEAMAQMKDNEFDLAIVDPPFGIGETWKKNRRGQKEFKGSYRNDKIPAGEYFHELFRVSKAWIIWGANYFTGVWPNRNVIAWDKLGTYEGDRKSEIEIAVTNLTHRPSSIYRHQWNGGRKGPETGIKIIHPHQKPILLYKWLLKNYAKEGDKILDTHLGSGSSRIAAYDMGFDFVGYEIDKDYFEAQELRFKNHIAQKKLFPPSDMYQ